MDETMTFGVHLLFDAYNCDSTKLADKEQLHKILQDLPKKLDMHTISDEMVVEVGPLNEKDPGGISGFVMIAESHISFHTFPARGFVTADVYTCQDELDSDTILNYLSHAFGTTDYDCQIIDRGTRYPNHNL